MDTNTSTGICQERVGVVQRGLMSLGVMDGWNGDPSVEGVEANK